MNISFLGLGVMGYAMAGHLARAGHRVCVFNRTVAKAQQWVEEYGAGDNLSYEETPSAAAKNADIVILCVGNDNDVRQVVTGKNGVLSSLKQGGIIIDHTTTSRALAQELAHITKQQQVTFIDAPVSGGQAGAENGKLAIMVGGEQDAIAQITPLITIYATSVIVMGESGAGQATKMTNQLLIAGILQGMSEGFALAKASGLDIPKVVDAIGAGAAGSWQLANRADSIHHGDFDFGFAIDWMRKDLGFCLDAAKTYGLTLPNAQWVDQCYAKLQKKGYNRSDTSVLVKQYDLFG